MWYDSVLAFATNIAGKIVVAAIVLLLGFVVARLSERIMRRITKQLDVDGILFRMGFGLPFSGTLSVLLKYAIYAITVVFALRYVGLAEQALSVFAIVVILIVVVGMILGLVEFVPNFWAGLWLHRKRFLSLHEWIEVDGIEGEIIHMDVLETAIKTRQGDTIYLPSSLLLHSRINKKATGQRRS